MERRDKKGRLIGYNWWRVLIVESWLSANEHWWNTREKIALGYLTEQKEFELENPRPTLKYFMISLAHSQKGHL